MNYRPTLLEDSVDPWLAIEPDPTRRRSVLQFLMELAENGGKWEGAAAVPETSLPAFAAVVPNTEVVVVWIVVERYSELAVRRLIDIRRDLHFGQ